MNILLINWISRYVICFFVNVNFPVHRSTLTTSQPQIEVFEQLPLFGFVEHVTGNFPFSIHVLKDEQFPVLIRNCLSFCFYYERTF